MLGSGSSGNATLVEADGTRILLDAGLGPRTLAERLASAGVDPASLSAIFLSHEHQDHAGGAAAFSRKWGVPLSGSRGTYAAAALGAETIPAYEVLEPNQPRTIGALTVTGIPLPHDAAGPYAFVVRSQDDCLGHATDFGHVSRGLAEAFRDCGALLIESNYDTGMLAEGPYPWSLKERILGPDGHLSNADLARYLARDLSETCRRLVLAHLSKTNNHPEVVRMSAEGALRRCGRTEVALEITESEGTDWIEVTVPAAPRPPQQLRLWA